MENSRRESLMADMPIGPSAITRIATVAASALASVLLLYLIKNYLLFDPDQAAMGRATSKVSGQSSAGEVIHCDGIDAKQCLADYNKAGRPPVWFWIGNSQLHGVNRKRPGDKNAPMALHDLLRPKGIYLIANSLPNATTPEFVMMVHGIGRDYNLKRVIIPVVFNGLRGGSVRESQLDLLRQPDVVQNITASRTFSYMNSIMEHAKAVGGPSTQDKSFAESFEDGLNDEISSVWPLWSERRKIRTLINYIYHRLFGVTAQTKRTLVGSGFDTQMTLLGDLLEDLRSAGIRAFVYVPPYRQDVPGPYIESEYIEFKSKLKELAANKGADFTDIDNIVPGPEWGFVEDYLLGTVDYDFMHFTAQGHARLAEELYRRIPSEP
jgi:hypothetical protein